MKRPRFYAPLLAFTVGIVVSTACWGGNAKLSPELQGTNVPANLDVIIQYKQNPTSNDDQNVVANGGTVKSKFQHVKGGYITFLPAPSTISPMPPMSPTSRPTGR